MKRDMAHKPVPLWRVVARAVATSLGMYAVLIGLLLAQFAVPGLLTVLGLVLFMGWALLVAAHRDGLIQ